MSGTQLSKPEFAHFHPLVRDWFTANFDAPTPAQRHGWQTIASGVHSVILAPTGSGKTLASFLFAIDRLLTRHLDAGCESDAAAESGGVRLLYVSPLKALNYDIERNLQAPLDGIRELALERGVELPEVRVGVRTGDTSTSTRASILRKPPEILITTPESLYLMLTSPKARNILRGVEWAIVDEIHAIAGSKRGTHLAVSLERLVDLQRDARDELPKNVTAPTSGFQRIGLSATANPPDAIARLLAGFDDDRTPRPVQIVDASAASRRQMDLEIDYVWGEHDPDDGPRDWPATNQGHAFSEACRRVVDLVRSHRATLVFAPSRGQVEQMVKMVNEMAGEDLVSAHHGSIAHDQRRALELALKNGEVRGIVCTSTLEMGIDMGALDCIVQYASPRSAAAGLQRVGRSGHGVGETSFGRVFARNPADLLECAAAGAAMAGGDIEPVEPPDLCLDVAAQHVVSMVAVADRRPDDVLATLRRAYPFESLSHAQLNNVIAMLEGRFADERYRELSPRLTLDAATGMLQARRGARLLATTNGGTIPDRGEFAVRIEGADAADSAGNKVGELDEEFVGDLARDRDPFVLGASTWRTTRIDHSNVFVVPAPGAPGAVAFWNGENTGRGSYLAKRVAALTAEIERCLAAPDRSGDIVAQLVSDCRMTPGAARKLVEYCTQQRSETGVVPSERSIPVEIYRDEIGDLRIVIHSLFGWQVNGAWAHALKPQIRNRYGNLDPQVIWTGDGIIVRLPDMADEPDLTFLADVTAGNVGELLLGELADAPMFALRFRESAQRALLLPKGSPHRRTPLWLQRQRAADLLSVVRRKDGFPVVQEAVRECYQEYWDLEGLRRVLRDTEAGEIEMPVVHTQRASAFASSLDFQFMRQFAEDGDAPRGECRAAFLALDRDLLAEVLRIEDLRSLLDVSAVDEADAERGRTHPDRKARTPGEIVDLLTDLGDLSTAEIANRYAGGDIDSTIDLLAGSGRITEHERLGRWVTAGDRGCAPTSLALRHLDWAGPIPARALGERYGLAPGEIHELLDAQTRSGALVSGHYRPGGNEREWCRPEVVTSLHRRSLARARQSVVAVPVERYATYLQRRQLGAGFDDVAPALDRLENTPLPIPVWEQAVLPARVRDYRPGLLDAACGDGSRSWWGRGRALVAVTRRGRVAPGFEIGEADHDDEHRARLDAALMSCLEGGGGWFVSELARRDALSQYGPDEIADALFGLTWNGRCANDLFAAFRWWVRYLADPSATAWAQPANPVEALPAGRWQSRGTADVDDDAGTIADELLDRYGVVCKQMLRAERRDTRWIPVYSELRRRVMTGEIAQGHFVDGLEGAQFARAKAIDELRETSCGNAAVVLAGADPANIWGRIVTAPEIGDGAIAWKPRVSGSIIVTVAGAPALVGNRWGRELFFTTAEPDIRLAAICELRRLATWRSRTLRIEQIDAVPAIGDANRRLLEHAGFGCSGAAMTISARSATLPDSGPVLTRT